MALREFSTLVNLEYDWLGTPFVQGSPNTAVEMVNFAYDWLGTPFVGNPTTGVVPPASNTSNFFFLWY